MINWILRLFSCRNDKNVALKRRIQYVYEHITIPWLRLTFTDKKAKLIAKDRATICSNCKFSEFGTERENFLFNRRLISTKKVICTRNKMDLTLSIPDLNVECPINKWKKS